MVESICSLVSIAADHFLTDTSPQGPGSRLQPTGYIAPRAKTTANRVHRPKTTTYRTNRPKGQDYNLPDTLPLFLKL